ncbi:unnamed protein product [Symbiodinium sp. CCMP2592]|nr:unnamed protein product [Symbiodinium sp. CCMP2592]
MLTLSNVIFSSSLHLSLGASCEWRNAKVRPSLPLQMVESWNPRGSNVSNQLRSRHGLAGERKLASLGCRHQRQVAALPLQIGRLKMTSRRSVKILTERLLMESMTLKT